VRRQLDALSEAPSRPSKLVVQERCSSAEPTSSTVVMLGYEDWAITAD
jgi:hypothetical protein